MIKIITACALNIALFTNSLAQEPPPEIYDNTNTPYQFTTNHPYTINGTIYRPLVLQQSENGFKTNSQITIQNTISANSPIHSYIWKLGTGHMQINSANTFGGSVILYQGSLGIGNDYALGLDTTNMLEMATGTTLNIDAGINMAHDIYIQNVGMIFKDPAWDPDPALPFNDLPATINIAQGTATLNGTIISFDPINKTGLGKLKFNGAGLSFAPLNLQQGELQINGIWISPINTEANTILSGTGFINSANITGQLNPGTSTTPGQIQIDELNLASTATTNIRIQNQSNYDSIYSMDSTQLDGALIIHTPENQIPTGKYTIVESGDLMQSRFKTVAIPKSYISPILTYKDQQTCEPGEACQSVELNLQYNSRGLNYDIANWQAATIMDSRFIRDTAKNHSASGKSWAQAWFANSTWHKTDRDTSGIQIGKSFNITDNNQISAFAGVQQTKWRNTNYQDTATYAGLAYDQNLGPVHINLGHAIARHKGKTQRQADINEAHITNRPTAINQQSWLNISPKQAFNVTDVWQIKPYMEINHIHSKLNTFKESGSLAAIDSPKQSQSFWLGQIGLDINSQWKTKHGTAQMQAKIGVVSNFSKDRVKHQQTYRMDKHNYTVYSHSMPKTSLRLDLGVKAPIAKRSTVQIAYTGEHSKQQKQHGIWGGINVGF